MMSRLLALVFFVSLTRLVSAASPAPALPLQDGEHLSYRVSWAIVPGAGEIKIDAKLDPATPKHLVLTTTTATRKFARMLMPFEAKASSTFDLTSGRLISLHERSTKRAEISEHTVTFDYEKREATYTRTVPTTPAQPPRALPMPDGVPTELIMGLLQTRTWNLQPNEKQDALVLFDDDFYELTIHALRFETVKTPLGSYKTLVLEPRMEKTAPKGMFKKGGTVRVWISQDEQRLPVKFEVEFKIGTGTAMLDGYRPPTASADKKTAAPASVPAGSSSSSGPAPEPAASGGSHATNPRP